MVLVIAFGGCVAAQLARRLCCLLPSGVEPEAGLYMACSTSPTAAAFVRIEAPLRHPTAAVSSRARSAKLLGVGLTYPKPPLKPGVGTGAADPCLSVASQCPDCLPPTAPPAARRRPAPTAPRASPTSSWRLTAARATRNDPIRWPPLV